MQIYITSHVTDFLNQSRTDLCPKLVYKAYK